MKCAWKELTQILPPHFCRDIDVLGADGAQEIRLRLGFAPYILTKTKKILIPGKVSLDDLNYVLNAASRYSPWTAATAADGYITAQGGHRVGLCGEAVIHDGTMTGFRKITSVNIRVARDFLGIAAPLSDYVGNVLILGPPGSGKTTLLRDLIRYRSKQFSVSVVDERCELFPYGFSLGDGIDVISGCNKSHGVITLLRTMSPDVIAVDEITAKEDADALIQAHNCGVTLLATAHAGDASDFCKRGIYQSIVQSKMVDWFVTLRKDKSYTVERFRL